MLLSGSCCRLLALHHPGPSRGTYEMHLSTVCPGHKGGGSLYPSVANTTGQGWIYTGSFPHGSFPHFLLHWHEGQVGTSEWLMLGYCRNLRAGSKNHVWEGTGHRGTYHVTKTPCFLGVLHLL